MGVDLAKGKDVSVKTTYERTEDNHYKVKKVEILNNEGVNKNEKKKC